MQIDRPIAIAVTLFIILLLAFFLVVPEYNTFKSLQTDLGIKKAEYSAQFDYYAAIYKTYVEIKNREDDIKKIDDALPQDPALGRLIYFLQTAAQDNGLIVKNLFLSKSSASSSSATNSTSDKVKDLVFSMDLSGSYSSLGGFLLSLEKSSRIFEVTTISFGAATGQSLQSFSLQIKTHSY